MTERKHEGALKELVMFFDLGAGYTMCSVYETFSYVVYLHYVSVLL